MTEEGLGELLRLIDDSNDVTIAIEPYESDDLRVSITENRAYTQTLHTRLQRQQQFLLRDALTSHLGDTGADLGVKCPTGCGAPVRIPLAMAIGLGSIGGHGDPGGYGWHNCHRCGTRLFVNINTERGRRPEAPYVTADPEPQRR